MVIKKAMDTSKMERTKTDMFGIMKMEVSRISQTMKMEKL